MIGLGIRVKTGTGESSPITGIYLNKNTAQYARTQNTFLPDENFTISWRCDWRGEVANNYYLTNDLSTGTNGAIAVLVTALNTVRILARDTVLRTFDITGLQYGDKMKLAMNASNNWLVYVNDQLQTEIITTGFVPYLRQWVWGGWDTTTSSLKASLKVWDVQINNESWAFDEGTGLYAYGSEGRRIDLYPNTANGGVANNMWVPSKQYATPDKLQLDFRSQNISDIRLRSRYAGNYFEKRLRLTETDNNLTDTDVVDHAGFIVGNTQVGVRADNAAPIYLGNNVCGRHSYNAYRFTIAGHGKTIVDDIYSVWQHSVSGEQVILYNISGNYLYFTQTISSVKPPTGAYVHISGATNTSGFVIPSTTVNSMLIPATNSISKKLFIDGVEHIYTDNFVDEVDNARIEEVYELADQQAAKDYLITQQGGGVLVTNNLGLPIIRITNNFISDDGPLIVGKMSVEALEDIPVFGHTAFLQQENLTVAGDAWYIPKTKEITTADGTFNYTNLTPYQNLAAAAKFTASYYENPLSPPDRQLAILNASNTIYVHGFLPVLDAAIGTRVNTVNESCSISTFEKMYMKGSTSTKVGTSLTKGDKFEVYSYRGVIPQQSGRTAMYPVHDYETGNDYLFFDYHDLPVTDVVAIPSKYQGFNFEVVEKTPNIVMAPGVMGTSLTIPVDATHNYGFLVIKIIKTRFFTSLLYTSSRYFTIPSITLSTDYEIGFDAVLDNTTAGIIGRETEKIDRILIYGGKFRWAQGDVNIIFNDLLIFDGQLHNYRFVKTGNNFTWYQDNILMETVTNATAAGYDFTVNALGVTNGSNYIRGVLANVYFIDAGTLVRNYKIDENYLNDLVIKDSVNFENGLAINITTADAAQFSYTPNGWEGSEIIINGDFNSATGWGLIETPPNSEANIAGNKLNIISTDGTTVAEATQSPLVIFHQYILRATATLNSGAEGVKILFGGKERYITKSVDDFVVSSDFATTLDFEIVNQGIIDIDINNISVKEIIKIPKEKIHVLGDSFVARYGVPTRYDGIYKHVSEFINGRKYQFTSDGVGGADIADHKTRFDATPEFYNDTLIIMDGGLNDTADAAITAIDGIVAHLTHDRWVYVQPSPWEYATGTPDRIYFDARLNEIIAHVGPGHYVEVLPALQLANDGSVDDLIDVANNIVPRSLRVDTIHEGSKGTQIRAKVVQDFIENNIF